MAKSAKKWLSGDTTYQQQLSNFKKSRTDYESQHKRQKGITTRDFDEMLRTFKRQGEQDREDQQNDFAGRGILKSGVYAQALGDYNTEFNAKYKNLQTGKKDRLEDLAMQRTNFLRQLQLEMQAAREDALRRRSARLGI